MTVNFVDPAKGVSTSALCTEAEAFDASKIVITYLVRRDHPSLKFRIPKASTAQIAALHPHIRKHAV